MLHAQRAVERRAHGVDDVVVPVGTQLGLGRAQVNTDDGSATVSGPLTDDPALAEGLAAAMDWGPDCVLLDLGLPDMTGFQLITRVKSEIGLRKLPTIVYTGKQLTRREEAELRAAATGLDPYDALMEQYDPGHRAVDTRKQRRQLHIAPPPQRDALHPPAPPRSH